MIAQYFNDTESAVKHCLETGDGPKDCIICGARSSHLGVFFSTEQFSKTIGARVAIYGLCRQCYTDPLFVDKVEQQLLKDLQVQ